MNKVICIVIICFNISACSQISNKTDNDNKPSNLHQVLYYGGDILTMEGSTPTYVEAVVQREGKIAFVGTKEDALTRYDKAEEVDLKGKTMLPAFLDGHGHFYAVGFMSMCANLLPPPDGPGKNYTEIVKTMNSYKLTEEGKYMIGKMGWIIGNGYDDSQLEERDHPKASDLDKVSIDMPVIIIHQSGHLGVLNSKAMEMLNITKETKDPPGGTFRRDADGKPNGVMEEAAFFSIMISTLGKIDAEVGKRCVEKGQIEYARNGYLTAQDGRTTKNQYKDLIANANAGAYYLDVVAYPDITLGSEYLEQGDHQPSKTYKNRFRVGGVKLTLDGSPQGKTAWLSKCYHVNPEGRTGCYEGYPVLEDSSAFKYVETAFKNKWQILCHSNGDAAIDQYISAVKSAKLKYSNDDHRSTLIHGQTLRKDQIPDMMELGIYASLFPMHTFYWGDWHRESVLGAERASYISPCRDVIDAGINLTSHHDAPVTFPNSMRVLDATVNRITRSGQVLGPQQCISVYEGLKTFTIWAANQYFEEDNKGTLTEGKLADFVILDKNPLKINPMKINSIKILESIKEGKTVFAK